MSKVVGLGRINLRVRDVGAWTRTLVELVGAEAVEPAGDQARFRIDEAAFRIAVEHGPRDELASVAWEVAGDQELDAVVGALRDAGVPVEEASAAEANAQGVRRLVRFCDPSGYRLECYHTPTMAIPVFASPVGASFVTGGLGLGHVVLGVADRARAVAFYRDLLGFRLSDEVTMGTTELSFLHCNARHHSLALAEVGEAHGLLHFMVEMGSLDDVGRAYDRGLAAGEVAATLGRHSNDHVVSFYLRTPSPWSIEIGWGGRLVEDASWRPAHHTGTSVWGHHPVGQPA